jgi:hypothetical protein
MQKSEVFAKSVRCLNDYILDIMTIGSHIAEILRQGLWASLSGGWFYEPTHSLFCNTTHLYLWLLLAILPLIFSLFISNYVNASAWILIIIYAFVILVIFTILKLTIWYLHAIFDSNDPILYTNNGDDSIQTSRQHSLITTHPEYVFLD